MTQPLPLHRLLAALLATLALAGGPGWGAEPAPPSREALASQLANVKRLINISSGAKRVEYSGNVAAQAHRTQASRLLDQAEEAFEAKRYPEADRLIGEATRTMFEAIRLAGAEDILNEKRRNDFDARAASVEVLLGALRRIAEEKGRTPQTEATAAQVERDLSDARSLMAAGDLEAGAARLDVAYDKAKRGVEALRRGDTLVRTLKFATPEEEYHYELDRNDTHRMLVDVLLEQKRESASIDAMVGRYVQRAESLRTEAEQQAGGGEFAKAVHTLEESTRELVRAIRSAGVYIPG